jgi:hypothetical protein
MSNVGEEYLIQVAEKAWFLGEGSGGSLYLQLLDNNLCENAFPTSISTGTAQSYFGTFDDATADTSPSCGGASAANQPGIWYKMWGMGFVVQADTCTGTNVDTQISVYKGSCNSLECVGGNDNICGYQSAVSWNAESGVEYYILVHGGNGVSSGSFSLTIEGGLLPNEICANAEPLVVVPGEEELQVTVPLASPKADAEVASLMCPFEGVELFGHPNRGVWYSVNSTGATYSVSIQDYAASVSVFSGSCQDLECIMPDVQAVTPYTWESMPGQECLIYIHYTRNNQGGDVQMTLSATNDTLRN